MSLAFAFFGSNPTQPSKKGPQKGKQGPPVTTPLLVFVFVGLLSSPGRILAQPAPAPVENALMDCVVQWEKSRGVVHDQDVNGAYKTELEAELVMTTLNNAGAPTPTGFRPAHMPQRFSTRSRPTQPPMSSAEPQFLYSKRKGSTPRSPFSMRMRMGMTLI